MQTKFNEILITQEQLDFESKQKVWHLKLFGAPMWHAVRAEIPGIRFRRKISLYQILLSILSPVLLAYLLIQIHNKKLIFIEPRLNLISSLLGQIDIDTKTIIFCELTPQIFKNERLHSTNHIIAIRILFYFLGLTTASFLFNSEKCKKFRTAFNNFKIGSRFSNKNWKIVYAKAFSDNLFSKILIWSSQSIVFCGGSAPNSVSSSYTNIDKVTEFSHGYIGKFHHMYWGIDVNQCRIYNSISDAPLSNREALSIRTGDLFAGRMYKFSYGGNVILIESGFGLVRKAFNVKFRPQKSLSDVKKLTVIEHPKFKLDSSTLDQKISKGVQFFVEPSSEIITLRNQMIPFVVVCEDCDRLDVGEYYNIDNIDFCSPTEFVEKFCIFE